MHTFVRRSRATQQATDRVHFGPTREVNAIRHSRRVILDQPGRLMAEAHSRNDSADMTTQATRIGHDFSRIPVHAPAYAAGSGGRSAEQAGSDTRVPWSLEGAGVGALGGAIIGGLLGGPLGAPAGMAGGGVAGGPAGGRASVVPTAIDHTKVEGDTPSLSPTFYGSIFRHTLSTSGGTITPDVTIAEAVAVTRDDFATGFKGVPLGTLTWGPGGTAPLSGNDMFDNIGTGTINVTNFLPSPPKPGLPAIMATPQKLHYRIGTGNWKKFADVPMTVTLRAKRGGGHEVETRVNNVPSIQNYTGAV